MGMIAIELAFEALVVGEARPRDTAWMQLAIKLSRGIGIDLFEIFPPWVNRSFDLSDATDAAQYFGLVCVVSLALAWSAAALILTMVSLVRGLTDGPRWLVVEDKAAVLVLSAFAWPGLSALFWLGARGYAKALHFALGGLLCLVIAALGVWLSARPAISDRWISRLGFANTTTISLALAAGLLGVVLAPEFRWSGVVSPDPDAPNVVLISIDTLRADHLGCYGYPRDTSPAIDRIAAEGVLFENAVSPTSWTLPSHMSMMTGLSPAQHRITNWGRRLDDDVVTLAEVARESGYATAGFVAGPFVEGTYGFSNGFDVYDDHSAMMPPPSHQGITSPLLFGLVDRYLGAWNSADRPVPFFIFLHLWDVHHNYQPPAPFDSMFGPVQEGVSHGKPDLLDKPEDAEELMKLYDGEIRYVDTYVERLFQRLEELGIADDTILAITADHGEEFLDHGRLTHRQQLYEESIRVPLIIRWPEKIPPGQVVAAQVRLQDIAPSLASMIAQSSAPEFGRRSDSGASVGVDLSPLILAGATEAEWEDITPRIAFGSLDHLDEKLAYARTNRFKLIRRVSPIEEVQLYDLWNDPDESTDLSGEMPDMVAQLSDELDHWQSRHNDQSEYFIETDVSEEHKANLRALGYIE